MKKSYVIFEKKLFVIMGKRLQQLINYVIDNGYVTFNKDRIGTLNNISDKDAVILIAVNQRSIQYYIN